MGDEPGTAPDAGPCSAAERAQAHAGELSSRIAAVAESIAESEDMVAETFEESARLRPHAADRLRAAAREARDFAEQERAQGRLLRERPFTDVDDAEAAPDRP